MPEYFISFYTGNPRQLYCRCGIASLSNKGLALFKQKSGIDSISDFTLEDIKDIPTGTVAERYEHEESLRTFDRERRGPIIALWHAQQSIQGWDNREPSGNHAYIKKMLKLQNLAEHIKITDDETKSTDVPQDASAQPEPCFDPISKSQRGRPVTRRNQYFIKQKLQEPDKDISELINELNRLTVHERAEKLGVPSNSPEANRIGSTEREAIYAAVRREKRKKRRRNEPTELT
jgi:hypothetical protein